MWYTSSVSVCRTPRLSTASNGSQRNPNNSSGLTFDTLLAQQGIRDEGEAIAIKRVLAFQLQMAMRKQHRTKPSMAKQLRTSCSQRDRLLDPRHMSVTLDTITRAAQTLGNRVTIRLTDTTACRK
jgi:hypothetical protein